VTTNSGLTYKGTMYVNLCGHHVAPTYCPIGYDSVGYLVDDDKQSCLALSMSRGYGSTTWTYAPAVFGELDSDGISFVGNTSTTLVAFNTSLSLRCNENISDDPVITYEPNTTDNNNTFVIHVWHQAGCGHKKNGPLGFLNNFKWISIPVTFVLGCYLMLFGTKSIRVLFAFFGGCAGFILGSAVVGLISKEDKKIKDLIQFIAGFLTALLIGLVSYFVKSIARLLTGAAAGIVLLLQIYYVVGFKFESKGNTVIAYDLVFFMDTDFYGWPSDGHT
jgi:hypothetical protein